MTQFKRNTTITARTLTNASSPSDTVHAYPTDIPIFREPILPLQIKTTPKLPAHPLLMKEVLERTAWPGTVFFPDTSFLSNDPPSYLLTLLLRHGVRVPSELLSEMNLDRQDTQFRQRLWSSLQSSRPDPSLRVMSADELRTRTCFAHYHTLLKYRKWVGEMAVLILESKLGRSPTDTEIDTCLKKRFGARGFPLARKGWRDRSKQNRYADEQLVVAAALTAICERREVVILTFDTDVYDQFVKLAYLLSIDYRSMLVAEEFLRNPFEGTRVVFPGMSESCGRPLIALKLRHNEVASLVPHAPSTNIYCLLCGNTFRDLCISHAAFNVTLDIGRLLSIKARTGLNSDKLGGRNIRVEIQRNARGSLVAAALIGHETPVRVANDVLSYHDLKATLSENDCVITPVVDGHNSGLVSVDKELVLYSNGPSGLFLSDEARAECERRSRERDKRVAREYCQPICEYLAADSIRP